MVIFELLKSISNTYYVVKLKTFTIQNFCSYNHFNQTILYFLTGDVEEKIGIGSVRFINEYSSKFVCLGRRFGLGQL